MATKNSDDEPEVITVIEQVLDNQMFLVAVIGGAVLGAILLYAWLEYQKNPAAIRAPRPRAPEYDPSDSARADEVAYSGEDGG